MTKQIVYDYISKNKMLLDAIGNVCDDYKYYNDFKQSIYLQIFEVKEDKLIDLYKRGELDWFCLKIITNNWTSTTSKFYREYKKNQDLNYSWSHIDDDTIASDEFEYDDTDLDRVDERYKLEELKDKINYYLNTQYVDFMSNQYHKTLFELYVYEKKTLKDISELTGITIISISRSVRKTKKYLKKQLTEEI